MRGSKSLEADNDNCCPKASGIRTARGDRRTHTDRQTDPRTDKWRVCKSPECEKKSKNRPSPDDDSDEDELLS